MASSARDKHSYTAKTLHHLSAILSEVQWGLNRHFGIKEVYVGGGSSRSILDHILLQQDICMRDFDLFAVVHKKVDSSFAECIGKTLASPTLGIYSSSDLRPRIRSHPSVAHQRDAKYIAGFGFFWKLPPLDVDLSLFHSSSDLDINGLLDVDRIMIPVGAATSLIEWRQAFLATQNYIEAQTKGLIRDYFNGYSNFRDKTANVLDWVTVERDPIQSSIRIIRTYLKMGRRNLDPTVSLGLKKRILNNFGFNRLQTLRNFLKLLADEEAPLELKILQSLGVFKIWAKALDPLVENLTENELSALFANINSFERIAFSRFTRLIELLGHNDRDATFNEVIMQSTKPQTKPAYTPLEKSDRRTHAQ